MGRYPLARRSLRMCLPGSVLLAVRPKGADSQVVEQRGGYLGTTALWVQTNSAPGDVSHAGAFRLASELGAFIGLDRSHSVPEMPPNSHQQPMTVKSSTLGT